MLPQATIAFAYALFYFAGTRRICPISETTKTWNVNCWVHVSRFTTC